MRKLTYLTKRLPWMLVVCLIVTSCKRHTIHISNHEICDPKARAGAGCLPLDARNAVALTVKNGQMHLIPMPADSLLPPRSKDFAEMQAALLAHGLATPFDPEKGKIQVTRDAWEWTSSGRTVKLPFASLDSQFVVIMGSDGEGMSISRMKFAVQSTDITPDDNLTNSIKEGNLNTELRCNLIGLSCTPPNIDPGIGVMVVVDDAIEWFTMLRVQPGNDFIRQLQQFSHVATPGIRPGSPLLTQMTISQPFEAGSAPQRPQPMSLVSTRMASGSQGGKNCPVFSTTNEILKITLGSLQVWHSDLHNNFYILDGDKEVYRFDYTGDCNFYCFMYDPGKDCLTVSTDGSSPYDSPDLWTCY